MNKDLIIPKELMREFNSTLRIVRRRPWPGIWPIDIRVLRGLNERYGDVLKSKTFQENYEVALVYKGKTLEKDLAKLGVTLDKSRVIDKGHIINGIPVPWQILRKYHIDNKKFDVIFAQKMR